MKLIDAVENNDIELVKKLINEGYPLNEKNHYDDTALMIASYNGHKNIVIELINACVSLDDKNSYGNTALIYASSFNHVEIVIELIKAVASLTEKDKNGNTTLDYNKEMWQSFEIQELLLTLYPDKFSFLEEKVGIHKDILLKLKMKQILDI